MDELPVEVIGNILSLVGDYRNVVLASATCRKWRAASLEHLRSVTFDSEESPIYLKMKTNRMTKLITETVFRTSGIRDLTISMEEFVHKFSTSALNAWMTRTVGTLRRLFYRSTTKPDFIVTDIWGTQELNNLEELVLVHGHITGVEPGFQRFPCLSRLSLCYVLISALDLSLLLDACPKIQSLELICAQIRKTTGQAALELRSSSVKSVFIDTTCFGKLVLEAGSIERLHLQSGSFDHFELVEKGTLKHLVVNETGVINLGISGSLESVEAVDLSRFVMTKTESQIISRCANLRKLRLWDIYFYTASYLLDFETIAVCLPRLSHLSLRCALSDKVLDYMLKGSSQMRELVVLELGWTEIGNVSKQMVLLHQWVEGIIIRCPILQKLVVHGVVIETKSQEINQIKDKFTSSITELMRKFVNVELQFEIVTKPECKFGFSYY